MRYLTPSAAVVAIVSDESGRKKILLQKRNNTGFGDGMWDLSASGHVENGESIKQAAVRECREETGLEIDYSDLRFFALIHKRDKACGVFYYNAYFVTEKFRGTPRIKEGGKCSQLAWFYTDELPEELLPDRKVALQSIFCDAEYYDYCCDI